ncbi:MAG: sulfoxide reductase heme-binding subunit YedZ [Telmatospirillum sp.]|nr:protein-methionine-sulfoxide reductase heme-binding subunit MsrQ [Telmatospirillum sp.]MDR3435399.1 sulfoxide reductase heme-binding subunit YedZ [Telmatospirillum sp.]
MSGDRRKRTLALGTRSAVHFLCLLPLAVLLVQGGIGDLGANPIEALIRGLGDWALRFLVVALAVTPVRRLAGWPGLASYRRMVGLWAFAYAGLHVSAYVVLDQYFDWTNIGGEILKHKFITAGMLALTLLMPLAATSTRGMIRRLGGVRWRRLHRLVYLAGPLAAVHYVWMVKADIRQPLVYLAIVAGLLACRVALWLHSRSHIRQ